MLHEIHSVTHRAGRGQRSRYGPKHTYKMGVVSRVRPRHKFTFRDTRERVSATHYGYADYFFFGGSIHNDNVSIFIILKLVFVLYFRFRYRHQVAVWVGGEGRKMDIVFVVFVILLLS